MNLENIREKCKGCEYSTNEGCLEHNNNFEPFIANKLGNTCIISDKGIILYYQDINDCDKWHLKK